MWSWLRRRGSKPPPGPASTAGQREADKALDKEDAKLREVQKRTGEIMSLADELQRMGRQNDFASRLREAMGGGH
jgi:hypothetical protein